MIYNKHPFYPWNDGLNPLIFDSTEDGDNDHVETLLYDNWSLQFGGFGIVHLVLIIIYCSAIISNTIFLSFFFFIENLRTVRSNLLIGTLPLCNCFVCCHIFLYNLILEPYHGPSAMCDFIVYAGVVFCAASNVSRCAIAVDRYIFISDPLRHYERVQGKKFTFATTSSYIIVTCLVIVPYVMAGREDNMMASCLPAYPKYYLMYVTTILVIIPSVTLCFIYTRIFYWAFLQMQILRQETKLFAMRASVFQYPLTVSPHNSVTSDQLRVYTGAAMLLTPSSPFRSIRESLEMPGGETIPLNFDTAIHEIIHTLAGLKDFASALKLSTSVDQIPRKINATIPDCNNHSGRNKDVGSDLKSLVSTSVDGLPLEVDEKNSVCNSQSGRKKEKAKLDIPAETFDELEIWALLNADTNKSLDPITPRTHSSKTSDSTNNTNDNAKISHKTKYGSRADPDSYTFRLDDSMADSSDSSGSFGSKGRHTATELRKESFFGYVPVTPEGKLVEEYMANFDFDVKIITSEASSRNQDLPKRLFNAEVKAAFMTMGLLGVFVLCWVPFLLIQIMEAFDVGDVSSELRVASISLIGVICALDPITYAVMNPPFRTTVSRSLGPFLRKNYPSCHTYLYGKESEKVKTRKLNFKFNLKEKTKEWNDNIPPPKYFDSSSV